MTYLKELLVETLQFIAMLAMMFALVVFVGVFVIALKAALNIIF